MSDNEFIAKPFISHDGTDSNGIRAEVKVITGHALVSEKTKPKSRDSSMVSFGFVAPSSNFPTKAWIDKEKDAEIFAALNAAYDNEEAVDFRIEIQRKSDVDRRAPFNEIAPPKDQEASFKNTFKHIVAVRADDTQEWIEGSQMLTSFKEDPTYGGARKASDDDIVAPGASASNSNSNAGAANNGNFAQRENSPYNSLLSDGSANPNGFALMTPVEIAIFVREQINSHSLSDEISADEEAEIVRMTLVAIGAVQKKITGENKVNPSDYSYKIAVALVKGTMENFYPLRSFENDFSSELKNHFKMIVVTSMKIANGAISYIEEVG